MPVSVDRGAGDEKRQVGQRHEPLTDGEPAAEIGQHAADLVVLVLALASAAEFFQFAAHLLIGESRSSQAEAALHHEPRRHTSAARRQPERALE